MKKIIAIAAILIMIASLAGCGETTNFLGGNTQEEKNTIRSDEVYIPIEKIRTLNPIVSKDEDAYYVDKLIYEGLFGLDKNLTLTNALADSYSYGDDGYSVTIRLKQGIYWQDGEELTADDVKFTIDALTSASYTNTTLYTAKIQNIKYTKLDSKDPYSITIYFNNNTNVSMSNFTFPIVAKHQFRNIEAAKNTDADFVPIGSGPYKVSAFNELTHIVLDGNSRYHGGNAPTNILNFQIIPKKRDAINLMDVNNISITFSKEIDRDTIYTNKNVDIVSFPSNEVELIGYNFRKPMLQDPRIRHAISCSINTEGIIESAYYKNGVQNDTIYFPNYLGISSTRAHNSYDMKKAKKLLTEAGFIDRNGDGMIENANNESLTVNILVNSEDQSRMAAAQIIKTGLDQLAVKSNIVSKDWNGYNSDLASGNFDIFIGGYQLKENYDLRFLLQTNPGNPIGYSNPTLDVLLDKLQSGVSEKERMETFKAIKSIMINDLPYDCLLYKTYGAIASPGFKGDIQSTFFDMYLGSQGWYSMIEVDNEEDSSNTQDETQNNPI
jgi:peptide/nickel transport system substrate-binding protein